jgi:hypothetical protein
LILRNAHDGGGWDFWVHCVRFEPEFDVVEHLFPLSAGRRVLLLLPGLFLGHVVDVQTINPQYADLTLASLVDLGYFKFFVRDRLRSRDPIQ